MKNVSPAFVLGISIARPGCAGKAQWLRGPWQLVSWLGHRVEVQASGVQLTAPHIAAGRGRAGRLAEILLVPLLR